jgi:glycerol-3-phosphate acyltransferase PlsY
MIPRRRLCAWVKFMMRPLLVILTAYLLGSIPFGYLIVRVKAGADVRATGSGGTGATNVSRSAGKRAGVITLLLDAAKGLAAVMVGRAAFGISVFTDAHSLTNTSPVLKSQWWVALAAVTVIFGHCFPVWLRFRGGKGVATGAGVLLVFAPLALGIAAILFLAVVWSTRYVSLGSITAAAAVPVIVCLLNAFLRPLAGFQYLLFVALAAAVLIIFRHQANIVRLLRGTESEFGGADNRR